MNGRTTALILVAILALASVSLFESESNAGNYEVTIDGVVYRLGNNTAEITEYVGGERTDLTIPEKIIDDGYTITGIQEMAFFDHMELKGTLVLPNTIGYLGNKALAGCGFDKINILQKGGVVTSTYFSDVDGGNVYTKEGDDWKLVQVPAGTNMDSFTMASQTKAIGSYAFYGCAMDEMDLDLSAMVNVYNNAFNGVESIKSLNFGTALKTIGNYAFANCEIGGSLTIEGDKVIIGDHAFENSFILSENNEDFAISISNVQKIGSYAFAGCELAGNLTIVGGTGDYCANIGNHAFENCYKLGENNEGSSITLTNVGNIGDFAFAGCDALNNGIELTNNINHWVGKSAFEGCTGITGVIIGPTSGRDRSSNILGDRAFAGCIGITETDSVVLAKSVNKIGYGCFSGVPIDCISINTAAYIKSGNFIITKAEPIKVIMADANVTYDEFQALTGVEIIAPYAFENCTKLGPKTENGVFEIGNIYTTIMEHAFRGCEKLGGTLKLGKYITNISPDAFDGITFDEYIVDEENENIAVENGLLFNSDKTILMSCFGSPEKVVLPDTLIEIKEKAFYGNEKVKSITIPSSVKKIGAKAFAGCINVTELVVGKDVKIDDASSFEGWSFFKENGRTAIVVYNIAGHSFAGTYNHMVCNDPQPPAEEKEFPVEALIVIGVCIVLLVPLIILLWRLK